MTKHIDPTTKVFTARFEIGDPVTIRDNGNWWDCNGQVIDVKPDKPSHHYRVAFNDGDYPMRLWFCEFELVERDDNP